MGLLSTLVRAADGPGKFDESDAFILAGAAVVVAGAIAHRILIVNPAHRRDENQRFAKRSEVEMTLLISRLQPDGAQANWASVSDSLKRRGVLVESNALAAANLNFNYTENLYLNELRRRLKTVDRKTRQKLADAALAIAEVFPSPQAADTVGRLRDVLRTG